MVYLRWFGVLGAVVLALTWRVRRSRRDADARVWSDATDAL
ncbi:hypothetical protein [Propioniciclava coleopterorum]|nr:hypothetical protein [Propioniciclava coleopterorum]